MARVAGYALARLARCSCSPTLAARCSAFLRPATEAGRCRCWGRM